MNKETLKKVQQKTKVQIEQQFLYLLLIQYILKLQGKITEIDGKVDEYISKTDLADAVAELLNDYGEEVFNANNREQNI